MIDLNKFTHFEVLARTGSFVGAAERLHMSQSALSRSIQALERTYGLTLFDRRGMGTELTRAGSLLLDSIQDLLHEAHVLEERIKASSTGIAGSVQFGVVPSLERTLLPELLRQLVTEYPDLRVRITTASAERLLHDMLEGDLEFLVGIPHSHIRIPDSIQVDILGVTQQPWLMVRKGHPLARRRACTPEDLAPYPVLASRGWNEALKSLIPAPLHPLFRAKIELDNPEVLAELARNSDGILIASSAYSPTDLVNVTFKPPLTGGTVPLALFTRRNRTMSPPAGVVAHHLAETMKRVTLVHPAPGPVAR